MAKLPGTQDLGQLPGADPTRPTGTFDPSGVARGGAALAEGARALGTGLSKFGEGVAGYEIDQQRWDYAKAHSDFLSKSIDLQDATRQDTNYAADASGKTLPERHADALSQIRDNSAALISSGPMRERFMSETAPAVAKQNAAALEHARGLENSANVAYVDQQGDNLINKGIATPDDDTRRQIIDSHNQLIDGLVAKGAVTPLQGFKMKQDWARQYATADVLHRADTDPQGVLNELRAAPGSGDEITNRILAVEGTGKNARSSANGTGQFIDSTWLDVIKRNRPDLAQGRSDQEILALRADKTLGRQMTDAYRQENSAYLTKQGVDATPGAQYLSHFLGPAGAAAVLKADPNMPVADALAKAVGKDKAAAMVAANPTILNGQLAGSVKQWADNKMGGQSPGGGSIYDILKPDVREQLVAHAQGQVDKQTISDRADFKARVDDAQTEAFNTGNVSKPITLQDFVAHYGAADGPQHFKEYDQAVQTGRAIKAMETMPVADRAAVVESAAPKPGEANYALKAQAYSVLQKAAKSIDDGLKADPAGYAASKLPASKDAYQQFQNVATGPDGDRAAAAQKFATTTLAEQGRVGVDPDLQRVVPKAYADHITSVLQKSTESDDPKLRVGLISQVQREAQMWGEYWPQVMRQLAPNVQPMVRAIAAGADANAMTRLLSLGKDESPGKVLKEQSETKYSDLTKAINTEMTPFLSSLVGRQRDRDYTGYYNLAEKLGALYVRDGQSATDAAHKAFGDLIGNRYDFVDTYRIPKSAGVSADDVQAGAQAARGLIAGGGEATGSLLDQAKAQYPALRNMDIGYVENPKKGAGYLEYWPPGEPGDNARPRPASLASDKPGLEIYRKDTRPIDVLGDVVSHQLVNTDPKIKGYYQQFTSSLTPAQNDILREQYDHAKTAEGETRSFENWKTASGLPAYFRGYAFKQWPAGDMDRLYTADQRKMFDDMMGYLSKGGRGQNQLGVKPAIDDIGVTNNEADSLSKFARDGKWVTSPDNSGLNLVYGDKFVRGADDKPLTLSWQKLGELGGTPEARQKIVERSIADFGPTP